MKWWENGVEKCFDAENEIVEYVLKNSSLRSLTINESDYYARHHDKLLLNIPGIFFRSNLFLILEAPWCNGKLKKLILKHFGITNIGVRRICEVLPSKDLF